MKRIVSLCLCLCLVFALAGCNNKEAESASTLQVGFGRTDITPQSSVQLMGYFQDNIRWSTTVLDPLYATCLAFTDADGNTVLQFTVDLCSPTGTVLAFSRKAISKETGIDINNIMISCTHTHSGPWIGSTDITMEKYNDFLEEQLIVAAKDALADRKAAEMYTTTTHLDKMNFVRHYRLDDGSVAGPNFGDDTGKTYVKHVKDADNEMQLIRFKREGGKDILLVNWQVHPLRTGGDLSGDISADLVGAMRMALEPEMGCYMAYFTGASGDLMPTSYLPNEQMGLDYLEQGALMAQEAITACDTMVKRNTGKVQILRADQEVVKSGATTEILTYAYSIGDVAFIVASYEMFDTNGKFIKDNSPFDMTVIASCSNTHNMYVAAEWAYNYGDIVAYEVRNGGFEKGTGEQLADGFVDMLNQLYPTK